MASNQIEESLMSALGNTGDQLLAAYLFGSVARCSDSPQSDVDIGILLRSRSSGTLDDLRFSLEAELERTVGRRVQIVILNEAPVDLVHRVLRDGRLLLDRDPAARIRFEVDARNRYFDLLPILERYRSAKVGAR